MIYPNHPHPSGPTTAGSPQATAAGSPSREIQRVALKHLHGVRVVEFIYQSVTVATPDSCYRTWEILSGPSLACTCEAQGPDDVRACWACGELWCRRFHSRSCDRCFHVFGVCCLVAITVGGVNAVVCKSCGFDLTAPTFIKLCHAAKAEVWD